MSLESPLIPIRTDGKSPHHTRRERDALSSRSQTAGGGSPTAGCRLQPELWGHNTRSRSLPPSLPPSLTNIYYSEHIMNDPSFLQCLSQHSTADPVDIVNIVATCYGFVGRPR